MESGLVWLLKWHLLLIMKVQPGFDFDCRENDRLREYM